jgi:hypothetical protein
MMRPFRLLSMIASAAVWLAAAPAMAGNDVVKCVDAQGRVTLTDQPCSAGSASVRLAAGTDTANGGGGAGAYGASGGGDTGAGGDDEGPVAQRHIIPAAELRHSTWRPAVAAAPRGMSPALSRAAPLARDVATLKAARRAMMLLDGPRQSLAGLP